jgi:putative ABC transport system permease protein
MVASARTSAGSLWQDVRYGLRLLWKSPGFTVVAVLTLALGVGANTTIFAWIDATLLTPIPGVGDTHDFVAFAKNGSSQVTPPPLSYLDYRDLRDGARSFTGLMAYHDEWVTLTSDEAQPVRVFGTLVSANYFDVLGVHPALGRTFTPDEERVPEGAPVVVLSYRFWTSRLDGDPGVLGKVLDINRHPYTVVGVAPPRFQGAKVALPSDLWIPVVMARTVWGTEQLKERDNDWLDVVGRLRPGVTRAQAQAEVDGLVRDLVARYPDTHKDGATITVHPLWSSPIGANALLHVFLPMLSAIAGIVLLLTCTNVANLVIVRSAGREREIAIRRSMGADGAQLLRQFLVEGLLLAGIGAGAALLLTTWTAGSLRYFTPPLQVPVALNSRVNGAVFFAALTLAVVTGIGVSLLPAMRALRIPPALLVREGAATTTTGVHRSRLGRTLVVAQVSLSVLLLVCAGLFIRSTRLAQRHDPGFDRNGVLLASFDLLPAGYSRAAGADFDQLLLARISAIPGVQSATLADWVPLCFRSHTSMIEPEGYVPRPREPMDVGRTNAGPDYFRTMRIPLVDGRDLTAADDRTTDPVAVVNEEFARRYWPGQEAVGKRVRADGRWHTVVGVARQATYLDPHEGAVPFIYLPILQNYYPEATLHVRVDGAPLDYRTAVSDAVAGLDSRLALFDVTTLYERTQAAGFLGRISAAVVGVFGVLALLLATVGIYGVVASATRQRTREVGIRIAVGGNPAAVVRLVLAQGFRLASIGLVIGLALALALTPLLRSQLFGLSTMDPVTYLSVIAVLSVVTLGACYVPARRAAHLHPMGALRSD